MSASAQDAIITNTRFIFGNQITSKGTVITEDAGLNTTPFSFEQAGFMAQEGFQNEMTRIAQQLATGNQVTILGQNVTKDSQGNILDVEPEIRDVESGTLGGATQLNLYTTLLTTQLTLVRSIVQKQLDMQNRVLSTRTS